MQSSNACMLVCQPFLMSTDSSWTALLYSSGTAHHRAKDSWQQQAWVDWILALCQNGMQPCCLVAEDASCMLHFGLTEASSAMRRFLFDRSMYRDRQRIARGAFAQVFTCHAPSFCLDTPELAVKVTDLPAAADSSISQVNMPANSGPNVLWHETQVHSTSSIGLV